MKTRPTFQWLPLKGSTQLRLAELSILPSLSNIFKLILASPRHLLVLRLTLMVLLLYGSSNLSLDVPLRLVCGLMLVIPALLTHQGLWVLICGLVWWINAENWLWIDNHKVLMSYWCLVCALGVSSKQIDAVLAWNGRILIGLVFAFATFWKLMAGEYLNGAFLHYTFLTDERVQEFAAFMGQLHPDILSINQLLETTLKTFPQLDLVIPLGTSPLLTKLMLVASYWTIIIEGLVALAFLAWGIRWLEPIRDRLLMTFIATTYFLLPVLGFAYVLIVMGLAQCNPQRSGDRIAYLLLLGSLQLTRFSWETLLQS